MVEAERYLDAGPGSPDQQLERQLYEIYFDKDRRRQFFDYFQEVETLYEILSPDAALREYIATYQRLADLYAALRSEYGSHGGIMSYDLGRKTELLLVRETQSSGEYRSTRTVEYDAKTLENLRKNAKGDTGRVMNLLRDLRARTQAEAEAAPALRGLFERAQRITEQFHDRQLSTEQAFDEIQQLLAEQKQAEEERTKLGMDAPAFGIYWALHEAKVAGAKELALEIDALFDRFPSYARSADELRQLKAEIYKVLLKEVSGKRMVELGDRIISQRGV
ncbi:MAG: hypothetical protein M5U28_52765 [Sandaracinaceae bacterium]|nr:hypothetical protein [Sandaracinaceae bacterium]